MRIVTWLFYRQMLKLARSNLGLFPVLCVSAVCFLLRRAVFSFVFLSVVSCVGADFSSLILSPCGLWSQGDNIKLEKCIGNLGLLMSPTDT
jgi:hypothetical protein